MCREFRSFGKTVMEMSGCSGTAMAQVSRAIHHEFQEAIVSDVSAINHMVVLNIFLYMEHVFVAAKPGSQTFHDIL